MTITPDTKDWTWVLERPCGECGFDARDFPRETFVRTIREVAAKWTPILWRSDVRARPSESTWSVLEYGCHVRDVCRIFDARLGSMLAEDNPLFQNWDQDETALEDRYELQDPTIVDDELQEAASDYANRFASVTETAWTRPGTRSNGSHFTVASLGSYSLHDLIHHLWDVSAK